MTGKFGDILLHGIYNPTSMAHYDSKWTCMMINDWCMVSLAEPVTPLPMYEPGSVFNWSLRDPEKTWRVLRRIDDE